MSKSSTCTPPAAGSGSVPAATSTQQCTECWTDDYEEEVSCESYGRYFRKYKKDGTEYNYSFPRKFKLYIPVKTGKTITVELRCKVEQDTGVSDADAQSAKSKLESGIAARWNGKFTLTANDAKCGTLAFAIKYTVKWVTSGEDVTVKVHGTYPREGVTGFVMDVSKTTSDWTYSHEYGHCVGLPDEYSYSPDTETVKYIKPDGTLDAAITAPFDGKSNTDPSATIMAAAGNTTVLPRHGWNIAIETQEILTSKLGRKITCTIS